MADLGASDLTYSFKIYDRHFIGRDGYIAHGTISLGNGSLTYPTGGIPITKGKMGLPRRVKSLKIIETNALGYHFEYDVSAEKLRLFVTAGFTPAGTNSAPAFTGSALAAHSHQLFVATGATDAAGARVNAATNSFAMNNAAATIAGIPAASGSAGGVVDITAGTPAGTVAAPTFTGTARAATAMAEAAGGSFAPSAMVLEVEAMGY